MYKHITTAYSILATDREVPLNRKIDFLSNL